MKFTYGNKPDRGECVAYIDGDGWLVISDNTDCVAIHPIAGVTSGDFYIDDAVHKFHKGDSVTITF